MLPIVLTAIAMTLAANIPSWLPQEEEDGQIGNGAENAHAGVAGGLTGMEVVPRPAGCGDSFLTGGSIANEAGDAPQVVPGHAHHVDPRVGVVDPVDRDLVDAEAVSFRQNEELRVEEPVDRRAPGGAGALPFRGGPP